MDEQLALVVGWLALFSVFAFVKNKVNKEGIFLANLVGLSAFRFGGMLAFYALLAFFMVGTIATNFREKYKKKVHGRRTTKNILANMGLPTIFLLLGSPLLFFAGLSAGLADTLSSEIGMLSKAKPRLITTFERVRAGRNGAVTMFGFAGGAIGALAMACFCFAFFGAGGLAVIVFIAGMIGTAFDSLLGATLERKGIIDNSQVNTLATFSGAVFALFATYL